MVPTHPKSQDKYSSNQSASESRKLHARLPQQSQQKSNSQLHDVHRCACKTLHHQLGLVEPADLPITSPKSAMPSASILMPCPALLHPTTTTSPLQPPSPYRPPASPLQSHPPTAKIDTRRVPLMRRWTQQNVFNGRARQLQDPLGCADLDALCS